MGLSDVSEATLNANRQKYFDLEHAHNSSLGTGKSVGQFRQSFAVSFRAVVDIVAESLEADHPMKSLTWLDFPNCLKCFNVTYPDETWETMGLAGKKKQVGRMIENGAFVLKYQGKQGEILKFLRKLRTWDSNTTKGVGLGFCEMVSGQLK